MSDRATLANPAPTSNTTGSRARFRPEIQALRAVAVLGVVVYHFFPAQLPGGYAGVDVFFVISGFLITGHLMRELTSAGRIRLGAFYARRARRLLPAAFLVLAASAILTATLLGPHHWQRVAIEIGASALYIENWALAQAAVDYLSPTTGILSPVQHYWSLSVEEQFYLVWPVLLLIVWLLAKRLRDGRWRRYALVAALSGVFVLSLALSIVQTATSPSLAYFATTTRAWEFAAGGLLALLIRDRDSHPAVRSALSWLGLSAIAVCFVGFDDQTPFPGYTALLPVLGTVLVIGAGSPRLWWSPRTAMALRPVRFLGDVSYSLYLWHWPLAVAILAVVADPGPLVQVAAFALSLVLAAVTRSYVELPAQRARFLGSRRPRFTLVSTAVAMALIVAIVGVTTWSIGRAASSDLTAAAQKVRDAPACLGAAAVAEGCSLKGSGPPIPGVLAAADDAAVTDACWSHADESHLIVCSAGPTDHPALRVALIGDSHANNYQDTLEVLAREYGWRVDFIGKSACPWSTTEREHLAAWNASCQSWVRSLTEHVLSGGYDLVITSSAVEGPWRPVQGRTVDQTLADGFVDTWSPVTASGIPIVAIKDIPRAMPGYLDCIHAHPTTATTACAVPQNKAFAGYDAQSAAAERVKGVTVLDYTKYFCQSGRCPAAIGGVIVYRNHDHLTGTYAATLAPMLRADVLKATGLTERRRD